MREKELFECAFAMPLTSPAYPPGPYRFVNREYLIITYRTDPAKLRAVVPQPLKLDEREALVKYEFIRMPDSNGFGDYTESSQVIPISFRGRRGSYTHCMFLNDEGPIAGGRELWGFPKKLAQPTLPRHGIQVNGRLSWRISSRNFGSQPAHFRRVLTRHLEMIAAPASSCDGACERSVVDAIPDEGFSIWTATPSPNVSQASASRPSALLSWMSSVTLHSRMNAGLFATRITLTTLLGAAVCPAIVNSSISGATWAAVAFICTARSMATRFQQNSLVSWTFSTVQFVAEKPVAVHFYAAKPDQS